MPELRVEVVATKEFKLGSKELVPPPNHEMGRSKVYIIELAISAAKAFVNRGLLAPAFEKDAQRLRANGVADRFLTPHYQTASEEKAAKRAKDIAKDAERAPTEKKSAQFVRDALDKGLMKNLEAALVEVGLKLADYPNNGARKKALKAWLEAN